MKAFKIFAVLLMSSVFGLVNAQNNTEKENTEGKTSYYEQRAYEDAKYEQTFKEETENEEEEFWNDQKQYEKDLKKRDRKAYRAYMKGKQDAYAEHYEHCNDSCHHSGHYYHHATFYYHEYHYRRYPRRNTINAGVNIRTPRVRLGIF